MENFEESNFTDHLTIRWNYVTYSPTSFSQQIKNWDRFLKIFGDCFLELTNFCLKILSMMSSTYLCESAYSTMNESKYKS